MGEARAIADESGQPALRSRALYDYAGSLDALGEHDEAARLSAEALAVGQQAAWPAATTVYLARMAPHWAYVGPLDTIMAFSSHPLIRSPRLMIGRAVAAFGFALTDHREMLTGLLPDTPDALRAIPMDHLWLSAHFLFSAALGFEVEDRTLAAELYRRLYPYRSLHASVGVSYWGPVDVALAVGARVRGEMDIALAHHETAAATIAACGAARPRALNGYQWARTLVARGGPGDRERALKRAEETLLYCQEKGYATLATVTESFLSTLR
jgi:hypothetical protein